MIAYILSVEGSHMSAIQHCISRLRSRGEDCRVVVFDSADRPLGRKPDCDFYRRRAGGNGSWKDDLALLASTFRAFPEARWIGRVERIGEPPVLPKDRRRELDCWITPNGYFVRRTFLSKIMGGDSDYESQPPRTAIADLVRNAGGRVGRNQQGQPKPDYVTSPALSNHIPLSAKAFCAVATVDVIDEVTMLVTTLRRHHHEPLILVCDEGVAERMEELALRGIEIEPITAALRARADKLSERVVSHDPYWKPEAIALKFHALRTAIRRHGPTHLLDADIVVNASLHTGGPWMADLVLSPFYWPDSTAPTPIAHG